MSCADLRLYNVINAIQYTQLNADRCSNALQLVQPFTRTDFTRRAFRYSAPSVWNSLPQAVLISDSTRCQFLNLDSKLFYWHKLSLNTDPTCRQRLRSYDSMATVWRYGNSIIIIPRPQQEWALSECFCLTSVCLSRTSGLGRLKLA